MPKSTIKEELYFKIANILRQEILENKIPEGTHFNEAALAERFGVSRGPVREALRSLEREGFANTLPSGRTISTSFSSDDIQYYYNMRTYIETESIKKILSEPETEDYIDWINQLEEILAKSKIFLDRNDENRFVQLDKEFHLAILSRANIKIYLIMWEMLSNITMSIMDINRRLLLDKQFHNLSVTYAFHDSILYGLRRRDLDYTLVNLETHLQKGVNVYTEIIDTMTDLNNQNETE
ncbi:MAG: GntR family transcriptional regulator [Christensenellaceae bacterium]|nr:GntR family transcriptional regulator [Christensenellaceae bacterium]